MLSWLVVACVAAAPEETSFAIVVGNNQSPVLGRRALQYADDDAVKYDQVFQGLVQPDNVRLFTVADDDTARLFPAAVARAQVPTRALVLRAFAEMAEAMRAGRAAGHHTRAYFVFAGHGDVDQGRGFLELQDGILSGDDLERALKAVGADEIHVILDSCNSFFVLSPRKPGGRHFATPKDAALQLAERLPNVGVLLSTSAEAEVYEWSEFQSGIFSHAVRSALTGAADVDSDGRVSYAEMAAFIDTASRSVPNPNFRPQVFARGPRGDNSAAVASFDRFRGRYLEAQSDGPLRLTLRDAQGIRWFDLHAEAKVPLLLRIPPSVMGGLTVERTEGDHVELYDVPAASPKVALLELAAQKRTLAGRGPADALKALYQNPFGPMAFSAWNARLDQPDAQPEFVGVGHLDVERMNIILQQAASRDRGNRMHSVSILGVSGIGFMVGGLVETGLQWNAQPSYLRWLLLGLWGGTGLIMGVSALGLSFGHSDWEDEAASFSAATRAGHSQDAVAHADAFIEERVQTVQRRRWVTRTVGAALIGLGALLVVVNSRSDSQLSQAALRPAGFALAAEGVGFLLASWWQRDPEEDLLNVWREDRTLSTTPIKVSAGLAPLPGGAAVSLGLTF